MVICKFYQSGRCRFGDNCKFEHIDPPGGLRKNSNNDPFSTPTKRDKYRPSNKTNEEEPRWPFTAIGIRDNAQQGNALTGDLSPEELRAVAYTMAARGLSNEVTQREERLLSEHKVKVDALKRSEGGQGQASGGRGVQPQDPFAQNGGGATQQGFGQSFQQQPMEEPSQGGNTFGQAQPFGVPSQPPQPFSQPQQVFSNPQPPALAPAPAPTPAPAPAPAPAPSVQAPLSSAAQEQFSAAQFGFTKVPESAPPPQFY